MRYFPETRGVFTSQPVMLRLTLPLMLLSLLSCDLAHAGPKQSREAYSWSGPVKGTLWLRNLNGAVLVETSKGAQVEIKAEVRWRDSNPADAKIVRRDSAAGTTFCGLFPARKQHCGADGSYQHDGSKRNDLELHFRVKIPVGMKLDIMTTNGSVQVEAQTQTLLVRTSNGAIRARATGPAQISGTNGGVEITEVGSTLDVSTVNGAIAVDLGKRMPSGPIDLSTTNGGIRLSASSALNADVRASTVNGGIRVAGTRYRRSAKVRLGAGGPKLAANTVNGSIKIGQ